MRDRADRWVAAELLLMGLALVTLAIAIYAPRQSVIMPVRSEGIIDLRDGPGGWVGCTTGETPEHAVLVGDSCYQVTVGDDIGLYTIARAADTVFGPAPPETIAKYLALIVLGIALVILPWLLLPLGGRPAVAMSPLVFLADPLASFDIYWAGALAILVGLPLLLLAARRWMARMVAAVLVVAVIASFFRSAAGLPLLVGAAVLIFQHRRWAWLVLVGAAYILPTFVSPAHVFWHTAYIGLGYLDNPYGIEYADASAFAVAVAATGTSVYEPSWETALRSATIDLVMRDPAFVARTLGAKASAIVGANAILMIVALAASFALTRREAIVGAAVVAATTFPGLIAVPRQNYIFGLPMALAILAIVAIGRILTHRRTGAR